MESLTLVRIIQEKNALLKRVQDVGQRIRSEDRMSRTVDGIKSHMLNREILRLDCLKPIDKVGEKRIINVRQ